MEISVTLSGLEAGKAFTCSLAFFSGLFCIQYEHRHDLFRVFAGQGLGGTFGTEGREFCLDSLFCVLDIFGL